MSVGLKENRRILDFKGRLEYVLPALKAIQADGSWDKVKSTIVEDLRDLGSNALEGNLISAYVTPALRNLRLTEGAGSSLRLTPDGLQCLVAAETDLTHYKDRLALQLIQIDKETAQLIPHLAKWHSSPATTTTVAKLRIELEKKIEGMESQSALRGWVEHLTYVGLIEVVEGGFYFLNYMLDVVKKGEVSVGPDKFLAEIKAQYRTLARSQRGSNYVPIPALRDSVCSTLGISQTQFYREVRRLFFKRLPGIIFSTPRGRRHGGFWFGRKYYYYIAIFEPNP